MDWLNIVRVGFKGLAVHKVRAGLSMLGIIFGVASVVAVIAVSEGARGEVLKQLAALGANNVIVRGLDWRASEPKVRDRIKQARLRSEGLTLREAEAIAEQSGLVESFAALRTVPASVRYDEAAVNSEVVGTTPSFLHVMGFTLRSGRWINDDDEHEARRVCVIEDEVRAKVFPLTSPLGETLVVDHEPYTVIGVLQSKEEADLDTEVVDIKQLNQRIYIPLKAALRRHTREPLAGELTEVVYHVGRPEDVKDAAELIERFYAAAHRMEGVRVENRDYTVAVAKELLKNIEESQWIFNIVMLCSAGISLVVGGIGIMNIMLANVSERRREVGIRRAVGATKGDILRQFLLESLIICMVGGLMGCVLGVCFTWTVHHMTGWQTTLAWWGMFMAVGVSLLDGVAFGTYPAWKAAILDPIEALRYE